MAHRIQDSCDWKPEKMRGFGTRQWVPVRATVKYQHENGKIPYTTGVMLEKLWLKKSSQKEHIGNKAWSYVDGFAASPGEDLSCRIGFVPRCLYLEQTWRKKNIKVELKHGILKDAKMRNRESDAKRTNQTKAQLDKYLGNKSQQTYVNLHLVQLFPSHVSWPQENQGFSDHISTPQLTRLGYHEGHVGEVGRIFRQQMQATSTLLQPQVKDEPGCPRLR